MDTVVTSVGLGLQAKLLPLGEDDTTEGVSGGISRVGGAKDLTTEVSPGQVSGVPLNNKVGDGGSSLDELGAHGHEEAVEDVDGLLTLNGDQTTVESTTELLLDGRSPGLVQLLSGDTEVGTGVNSVESLLVLKGLGPGDTELGLELVSGDGELIGLAEGGLGGNGVVVLIDQHTFVDLLSGEGALGEDGEGLGLQGLLDEVGDLVGDSMRLDEDESGVLEVGHGETNKLPNWKSLEKKEGEGGDVRADVTVSKRAK